MDTVANKEREEQLAMLKESMQMAKKSFESDQTSQSASNEITRNSQEWENRARGYNQESSNSDRRPIGRSNEADTVSEADYLRQSAPPVAATEGVSLEATMFRDDLDYAGKGELPDRGAIYNAAARQDNAGTLPDGISEYLTKCHEAEGARYAAAEGTRTFAAGQEESTAGWGCNADAIEQLRQDMNRNHAEATLTMTRKNYSRS